MTIQRMDHVGVVVDDLEAAISFFVELGMELDGGTTPVEGDWVDRVVGLDEVRVEIAFVRTPDGYGRLELTKFHNPPATTERRRRVSEVPDGHGRGPGAANAQCDGRPSHRARHLPAFGGTLASSSPARS